MRIALTLYCCDREAISWVATTGSINSSDVRDLMIESVKRRFGLISRFAQADRVAVRRMARPTPAPWRPKSPWCRVRRRSKAPQTTDVIDKARLDQHATSVPAALLGDPPVVCRARSGLPRAPFSPR